MAGFTIPNEQSNPNYAAQSSLDNSDLAALLAALGGAGVVSGGAVTPDTSLTMSVAAGDAMIGGSLVSWLAGTVTCVAATGTDRRDIVVVSSAGALSVVEGTPCTVANWTLTNGQNGIAPPVKPSIPAGSVLLQEVYVAGATSSIASGNLVDKRVFINPGQPLGIVALGTVTTAKTVPALTFSTASATTTAGDVCVFTLPPANALPGATFMLEVTNPSSGTVSVPTFAGTGSDTVVALGAGTAVWDTRNSAVNLVQFLNTDAGIWRLVQLTNGLSAYQEGVNPVVLGSGVTAYAVPSPTAAGDTMHKITLSTNGTVLTLPTFVQGMSITVKVITGGFTYSFAAASGNTLSWVGGSAPSISTHNDKYAFASEDGSIVDALAAIGLQ